MARRDEQQYEIHYATLVQTNLSDMNGGNDVKVSSADRRRSIELERAKAVRANLIRDIVFH